jgi:hypothetical protein
MSVITASFDSDPDFISAIGASGVTAMTIPLPTQTGNTCTARVRAFARGLGDGSSAMLEKQACIKWLNNGSPAVVPGGVFSLFTARADALPVSQGWDVNFAFSGGNIIVTVNGSSTMRVGWWFIVEILGFSNFNNLLPGEVA